MDNKYFDLGKDSHDYGFTFDDEPLLQNLAKNAEQPIIKWPDRGPILKKQIDKLIMLTEPGLNKAK
jgi:hypothetical protein